MLLQRTALLLALAAAMLLQFRPAAAADGLASESSPEDLGAYMSSYSFGGAAQVQVDDDEGMDFSPEDYSEMAAVLSDQSEGGSLQLGQGGSGAGLSTARSLAVGAAIKVLDTQLYVVRGLAVAAIRAGQALVAARNKVADARSLLAARLLASRLRAMRSVSTAGLRAGAALAGGALDAAQAKLRALDAVVRIGLAVSRTLGGAGLDAADAGRDLVVASLGARLQAIRSVAEAGLTLGRTLLQDLLGLPTGDRG
ncbi:Ribosome maturation factor RimM [Frankliniella fusca]|uniref:Ribosome maturation factor RimM n=1 Tax=Frankliniella fusca TaxID=407009 RepID=A0AAE1I0R1_9NEOP|nr:Ribosome maturation factor RimM [Frankliniella fusca]